jgi:hypothetical protein
VGADKKVEDIIKRLSGGTDAFQRTAFQRDHLGVLTSAGLDLYCKVIKGAVSRALDARCKVEFSLSAAPNTVNATLTDEFGATFAVVLQRTERAALCVRVDCVCYKHFMMQNLCAHGCLVIHRLLQRPATFPGWAFNLPSCMGARWTRDDAIIAKAAVEYKGPVEAPPQRISNVQVQVPASRSAVQVLLTSLPATLFRETDPRWQVATELQARFAALPDDAEYPAVHSLHTATVEFFQEHLRNPPVGEEMKRARRKIQERHLGAHERPVSLQKRAVQLAHTVQHGTDSPSPGKRLLTTTTEL